MNDGIGSEDLRDLAKFIRTVNLRGEETIVVGGVKTTCWVVETIFDRIPFPERDGAMRDAVASTWIGKMTKLTLQNTFRAQIDFAGVAEPMSMKQTAHTTKLRLNVDLPDSMFVFTPPPGTKETEDWTLPGITKPDVIGKPAPAGLLGGLLANQKGGVVLAYFATSPCVPCERDRAVVEKLHAEFQGGLSVVAPTDDYPELSLTSFPTTVLIDRNGKIASYEAGARGEAALRADLKKLGIGASK